MPGAAEEGGAGDRGVKSWKIERCKVGGGQVGSGSGWKQRERVGVKGDSLGRLSGRGKEGERERRQGELWTEGGRGWSGEGG